MADRPSAEADFCNKIGMARCPTLVPYAQQSGCGREPQPGIKAELSSNDFVGFSVLPAPRRCGFWIVPVERSHHAYPGEHRIKCKI
jgi:hypothetical protein